MAARPGRCSTIVTCAVWLDGEDANHMMLGPADGVDSHGRIEESHDGGQTWKVTSDGLQVPWRRHMAGTL